MIFNLSLVKSGLHYFVNKSPHSIWITVRKKFINNSSFHSTRHNEATDVISVKYLEEEHHESELNNPGQVLATYR